jgi:putative ABC transport system permease protein
MLRFELRMAWRELRPVMRRFLFMVCSIALGVGAMTGIKGTGTALEHAMLRQSRELIAADLAVRLRSAPSEEEMRALDVVRDLGAERTQITETLSMASAAERSGPLLATIKAVDPRHYPFFGAVELDPATPLARALDDSSAVVTREFLIRTGARQGDTVLVGAARFRLAAVLVSEPDRIGSGVDLGPRILITRGGLERTALIQFGSRTNESFLYKLPARGLDLDRARTLLKDGIPRALRIADYREPNPSVSRGLERLTGYLSLVGLLALLVGGLGVATTLNSYLKSKLDSIAVLKCLGARSRQVIRIYLAQGVIIGIAGSLAGVALGYVVQLVFPPLLRGLLEVPTTLELAPGAAIQGFLIGTTTTLLFLLPPLLAIRRVRPSRVFLREMPETRLRVLDRLRRDPLPLGTGLVLVAVVGMLASWLALSWRQGFGFIGGLAGAILALAAGAQLLLAVLRRIPRPRSLALRHGIKNLQRPGTHMASVLVALGIGIGFILTVYLVQTSLVGQIVKSAPSGYPNVFLLGVTEADREPLWALLRLQPGIQDAGAPIPAVPSRLVSIDGKSADQMGLEEDDRRYFQTEFVLTWSAALPPDTRVVRGEWWKSPCPEPMVSVGTSAARWLKIPLGATLEFVSSGKTFRARVANVREVDFSRPGNNNQFIFSPGALEGLPASYVGTVRVAPAQVASLQSALFERFPNVTSIDLGQVLVRVQGLIDKIATVMRFVALFAILAGVIILASSVAATRYQRLREAALLRTLGATRGQIVRIQAIEFLIVGAVAGLIGCALAAAAADTLLGRLLDTEFAFRVAPLLVGTAATAALAVLTGWLAGRGILSHKPLEILREN